jgi:hypothetical protein
MGTTGSGSTDSPAPSPTTIDIASLAIGVDTNIDATLSAIDIYIDAASPTIIGIAAPTIVDTTSPTTIVGITAPTVVDTASPTTIESALVFAIDPPATTVIDPISCLMGSTSARTGGFDMTLGLFNFHVGDDGAVELISISEPVPLAAKLDTPLAIDGTPSTATPPTPSEEDPRLETSTPSVGSNDFQDPPPSPTTAYCVDCDAYHFMDTGDFSPHEIAGYEDPRGGTAAIYPTISECERALNALTLQPTPYDPDYVEGLYSDYTCSDDDIYPEAKEKISNSASSCSSKSAISGSGYVVNYDSDTMIEAGSCIGDNDIYPLAQGKISDDSTPPFGGHCMMALHGDGADSSRKTRSDMQGRSIRVRYLWALILAPKRWPHFDSSSRSRKTRSAVRGESWNDTEMKPMRPADDMPSYHRITPRVSHADHNLISHLGAMHTTSPGTWRQNLMRQSYCPKPRRL